MKFSLRSGYRHTRSDYQEQGDSHLIRGRARPPAPRHGCVVSSFRTHLRVGRCSLPRRLLVELVAPSVRSAADARGHLDVGRVDPSVVVLADGVAWPMALVEVTTARVASADLAQCRVGCPMEAMKRAALVLDGVRSPVLSTCLLS